MPVSTYSFTHGIYGTTSYLAVYDHMENPQTHNATPVYTYGGYINTLPIYSIPNSDLDITFTSPLNPYTGIDYAKADIVANGIFNEITAPVADKYTRSKIIMRSSTSAIHFIYCRGRSGNNNRVCTAYLMLFSSGAYVGALDLGYTVRGTSTDGVADPTSLATRPEYAYLVYNPTAPVDGFSAIHWDNSNLWWDGGGSIYPFNFPNFLSYGFLTETSDPPEEHPEPFLSTDPYFDLEGDVEIPDLSGGGGSGTGSISVPGFPSFSVTDTGIIGLFAPSIAQMRQLADFMWTDFGGTGTTIEEVLSEIVDALKRSISNPLDYVVGFNIIPSQGLSIGSNKTIRFGFFSSGVSMPVLSSQYFTVDCGSISFNSICGNTFLDYAPYSKFSIYLPYIGFKAVDANDFVNHTIGVVYHGDVVSGAVTAYITKDGSVMYQYSGSCAVNMPLNADNWGALISSLISLSATGHTGVAASAAQVSSAGSSTNLTSGKSISTSGTSLSEHSGSSQSGNLASNSAFNPTLLGPQVLRSGGVSGTAGALGVQKPFVVRESVRFHSTYNFNTVAGYPSFYFRKLSEVTGFTTVLEIHLTDVPATHNEIVEIESLLKGGVIL